MRGARVLLFDEDPAQADAVAKKLSKEGFEVQAAHNFVEAAAHLAPASAELMLVYLPATEFVRNTFLSEAHAAAPQMPVVAIARELGEGLRALLERFGVSAVLKTDAKWSEVVKAIRLALEKRR